jgi:murein hydrolase activator
MIELAGKLGIFLIFFSAFSLQAQTKEDLEKQRMKLIREIEETSKFLQSTKASKTSTLAELKALETQISNRKKLIENIKQEIDESDRAIGLNRLKQDSLRDVQKLLKEQYAAMLRHDYLRKLSNSKFTYLVSSNSLNTFLLRWRYLRQFDAFISQKEVEIGDLNASIDLSNQQIAEAIENRKKLLLSEENNYTRMQSEIKRKDELLKKLSSDELRISKDLERKSKEREKLNESIEKIILAELAARKAKEAKSGTSDSALPAADARLEKDFQQNKSRLPWPVARGQVSSRFGVQPHPSISGVSITNNGIDISAAFAQDVSAVFEGRVVGVTQVPGYKNMVIIQHGSYYTVYSNLENVIVKKEDNVATGQKIGNIIVDQDGKAEIHFELWSNKTKVDPQQWLRKN